MSGLRSKGFKGVERLGAVWAVGAAFVLWSAVAGAQETEDGSSVDGGAAVLSAAEIDAGLAAWDRIFEVTSHPRCTNCHVGAQGRPMWSGLGYGNSRVHGMNIQAGESRIGAETVPCRTCHVTSARENVVPHAAPRIEDAWRLPPVELEWFGKGSAEVCRQLRDPETNDGHDIASLQEHVQTSPFVAWGFAPGAGRSAPAVSLAQMIDSMGVWGALGMPCVGDR